MPKQHFTDYRGQSHPKSSERDSKQKHDPQWPQKHDNATHSKPIYNFFFTMRGTQQVAKRDPPRLPLNIISPSKEHADDERQRWWHEIDQHHDKRPLKGCPVWTVAAELVPPHQSCTPRQTPPAKSRRYCGTPR